MPRIRGGGPEVEEQGDDQMEPDTTRSVSDVSEEEEEEEASMRAEVLADSLQQQQQGRQQPTEGGMCAAGRWLLGTLFAALGGFVGKNFPFPANAASASASAPASGSALAVWGAPYTLGCLALDAALVSRHFRMISTHLSSLIFLLTRIPS